MSARKMRVRMLVPAASVTASYDQGRVYDMPWGVGEGFLKAGYAERLPTEAEKLVEAAKTLGVGLVTARRDVTHAANKAGWGAHVRAPAKGDKAPPDPEA